MQSTSITKIKNLSAHAWILFFGYALLLAYFNYVDIYHHQFFSSGFTIISYNLMRLFFIVFLMWLFYAAGDQFLNLVAKKEYNNSFTLNSTLLAFFSGVGIWHIVLLCIGFAGLYNRPLMALLTLLVFGISLPKLNQWINLARSYKSNIYWPGLLLFLIPLFLFLITKGLYPAGGHDYYNHYFPFYRTVTETGSILPNDVWYHFYYSKGAALFFLSMLLTDPLAPQLATTAMILAATLIIFSLLKNKTLDN